MIAFLVVLVLLALLLQYRAQRRGAGTLDAGASFSETLVEPGASFELVLRLSNRSRAFLPFLRLAVRLPAGVTADLPPGQVHADSQGRQTVVLITWLAPRQKMSLPISLSAARRGRYTVQGLTVSCGDLLGLKESSRRYELFQEVVVLPREAPEQAVDRVAGGWPGDLSVTRFLYEDPILTVGYRDYTGREPMKTIAWSQVARTGKLMVRQYDHTLETSVTVVLDLERRTGPEELVEVCCSLARTVCRQLEDRGIRYAFQTNADTAGAYGDWRSVAEGLGRSHFSHILEGLGRALPETRLSSSALLEQAVRSNDGAHGLLFITPEHDPDTLRLAARWADRAGIRLWTVVGEEAALC